MAWCFSLIPMQLSFYSSLLAWWPVSIEKLTSLSNLLAEKLRTSACLGFCSPCITCYNLIPCPTKRSKSLFYMGLFYFATLLLITSLIEKTWRDILLRTSMNSALLRLLRLQLGSKLQVAQRHKPHGLDKPELEKHGFTMYATFPSKTTRKPSSLHPDIVWIHLRIFSVKNFGLSFDPLMGYSWPKSVDSLGVGETPAVCHPATQEVLQRNPCYFRGIHALATDVVPCLCLAQIACMHYCRVSEIEHTHVDR